MDETRPGLKICGITRREDLAMCSELGVEAVGLNFWSGSRRGLTESQALELVDGVAKGPLRVGVFVDDPPAEVVLRVRRLELDLVQPHGDAPIEPYAALGVPYVWVVRGTPELETLRVPEPAPAWVLLDAMVEGYGGEGRLTDWEWAARAVRWLSPLPVWLAGGVRPENAAAALQRVGPAGLDVASGAEVEGASRGEKDREKVAALLAAIRGR